MTRTRGLFATTFVVSAAFAQTLQAAGVHLPPPPNGGASIVSSGAARFLGADPEKLEIKDPLRIYNGGSMESLAAGRLDAKVTDRYFYRIFAGKQPLGFALLDVDATGAKRLSSVASNAPDSALPLASSVDSAMDTLATRKELQSGSYEARVLIITGISGSVPFYMLWLKPTAGEDWVYTLEQRFKPDGIETQRLYSTTEYLKLIQPAAQRRIQETRQQPAGSRDDPVYF